MSSKKTATMVVISDEAYLALQLAVGEENATREPAVLDGYAWQPTVNDDPLNWVARPVAVVLPSCTKEVQAVIRVCNEHGLKFKGFSTGWGFYSSAFYDDVVMLDLRRMNSIIEIDEKNMYAVVEPYVNGAQLQAEAMKVGLNTHIIGAGPACSPLASATSAFGVGWDGIYMSYGQRNLMGAEWVLPDGEVLKLGTLGSGLDMFCPDGPGPSLRGIVRGSTGALSGLGIFTKAAIKLYNWPGPPRVKIKGLLLDAQAEIPENFQFHLCFFPDRASLVEAVYKIGETEIGYIATRTSLAAFIYTFAPHLLRKIANTGPLRDVLSNAFKWGFTIMLAGNSAEEITFQGAALNEILARYGGLSIEALGTPAMGPMTFMNFVRVSAIPMVFRMGGIFNTALDRNEAWDSQMDWADKGEEIKRKWIERGGILDDLADNPFMALYEDNTWAHCEEIFQFDRNNEKHLEALQPLFMEFSVAAMEKCMEPHSACDARLRKMVSPMMGHYNDYQKKISAALDANRAADTGMYCDEVDFDLDAINPEAAAKLRRLVEERTWTESGPPE